MLDLNQSKLRSLILEELKIVKYHACLKEQVEELAVAEDLTDEEESNVWTLVQAGFPPLAAVRVIKALFKGNFNEAFWNLPGVNIIKTPEALYELIMKGLNMLPASMREDIMNSNGAKRLISLIYALKEVANSSDLSSFYSNLKALLAASAPALIAFAALLSSLAVLCAKTGTIPATIFLELATFTVPIPPLSGGLFAIAMGIEAFCAGLLAAGAGAGFVGFLINTVAKMDPDTTDILNDPKFKRDLAKYLQSTEVIHKEKFKKIEDAIDSSEGDQSELETSSYPDTNLVMMSPDGSPVDVYQPESAAISGYSSQDKVPELPMVAEGIYKRRLLLLAGLK